MNATDLIKEFDAVVMLTWSDWKKEPRSNRYHYATRFAKELPVVFVQPSRDEEGFSFEPSGTQNITILHVPSQYTADQTQGLMEALRTFGVRRPLLWIYNVFFEHYIRRATARMRIYHATEDYLSPQEALTVAGSAIRDPLRRVLKDVDLLVSVSEGVERSYLTHSGYSGPSLVLENGCDFEFWKTSRAFEHAEPDGGTKIALFQGGINSRLDYDLLLALAQAMPDWSFWFCGKATDAPPDWARLKACSNVRDFGLLQPEEIAALSRQAKVGLIPFKQDALMRRSLPLKAYEYVACGLPVVTIPIDALEPSPRLFRFATTADEFAAAIRETAPTRTEPARLVERMDAAARESYDQRFPVLKDAIAGALRSRLEQSPTGNILILYDDRSTHVRTIEEHLVAFRSYSRHRIFYLPATGFVAGIDDADRPFDLSAFDAVVLHYSIRLSIRDHLSTAIAKSVADYDGPKLLFIQDEYDATEVARQWIERLGIDAVFTTVPEEFLDYVYPRSRFPNVDFIQTLTGYVPEDRSLDTFAAPVEQRNILIGYRGRRLPHHYGDLGQEKYRIGVDVRRLAEKRGLPVDIEVDDSRRIYGNDWYRFLSTCRATLGTESGSNVFDFDGSLAVASQREADLPYEEFRTRHLLEHEGKVRMNQISPKIFEAIRLRTALVLFEGSYSGVVQPDLHFIPLKKDYSNFDDVVSKLKDSAYLQALTDRAYRDVIESGRYSYRAFIEETDAYLDKRLEGRAKGQLVSGPSLGIFADSGQSEAQGGEHAGYALVSDAVLRRRPEPEVYRALGRGLVLLGDESATALIAQIKPTFANVTWLFIRWLWLKLPRRIRFIVARNLKGTVRSLRSIRERNPAMRRVTRLVPARLKTMVRTYK